MLSYQLCGERLCLRVDPAGTGGGIVLSKGGCATVIINLTVGSLVVAVLFVGAAALVMWMCDEWENVGFIVVEIGRFFCCGVDVERFNELVACEDGLVLGEVEELY